MKSRRVMLMIEVDTDATLADLRKAKGMSISLDSKKLIQGKDRQDAIFSGGNGTVVQVQANVIEPTK